MSETKLERQYRCWDDCEMGGCPGHLALLEYQSDSEALHFSDGKGSDLYIQTPELKALMSMLYELAGSRVEIETAMKKSNGSAQWQGDLGTALEIFHREGEHMWDGFEEAAQRLKAMDWESQRQSWSAQLKSRLARWTRH